MNISDNATILSVEQTDSIDENIAVLITVLTPAGGSSELTEQLMSRFDTTAEELGIEVGDIVRFGESLHGWLCSLNCCYAQSVTL